MLTFVRKNITVLRLTFLSVLYLILAIPLCAQVDTSISDTTSTKVLEEIGVSGKKQAVTRTADRTIFDFSEQPSLNSGSLMDGLRKIPGLIISDVAGMLYQGKLLEVYQDGRPLNIYSDELQSYLNSMPANSIERVEIITNPGAEFPATSGGAIINIISSRYYQKYLTATYNGGYQFSVYDKTRHRFNNSLMIQTGSKNFSWQTRIGQSYADRFVRNEYRIGDSLSSEYFSDIGDRFYFVETGIKFDLKRDRILLNYKYNLSDNHAEILTKLPVYQITDYSQTDAHRHNVALDYQKRFKNYTTKLDFKLNYVHNTNDFSQYPTYLSVISLYTNSAQDFYQGRVDYSQNFGFLDESKFLIGVLAEQLDYTSLGSGNSDFDYSQSTLASYFEAQSKYNNFDFILGGRLENYKLEGESRGTALYPFEQTQFFPNATIQYNIIENIAYISAKYNRKIKLPNTSALDPNNSIYQNSNISFEGNPYLKPTLFSNYTIEASAFDYFSLGYTQARFDNQVMFRILQDQNSILRTYENIAQCTTHDIFIGLPFPYMILTQGLKKTLEFDFNPDEINFLYLYASYQRQDIPQVQTSGVWYFYVMSQWILPYKINFTTYYNTTTVGGNYYFITYDRPFRNSLDLSFSKKFSEDRLSISIFANDILNQNLRAYSAIATDVSLHRRFDSRRYGLSLSYKIPTKRKPQQATEDLIIGTPTQDKSTNSP